MSQFFRERGRRALGVLSMLILLWIPFSVFAAESSLTRPGAARPELPRFKPPKKETGDILPPLSLPRQKDTEGLAGGVRVLIKDIKVLGNTVLPEIKIAEIINPYVGKEMNMGDIEAVRDQLTKAYIRAGYINSGATIPDQTLDDGVLRIRVIEGKLSDIQIETDGRFRQWYLLDRLEPEKEAALNVTSLERRLQLFKLDPRIQNIQASLLPGEKLGTAVLKARVEESNPISVVLGFDNYEPPSIGSERGSLNLAHNNLFGIGDRIGVSGQMTESLRNVDAFYEIPINTYDTTLGFHFRKNQSEVIEEPFDLLDIKSNSLSVGTTLRHPLYRSLHHNFSMFLTGEYRESEAFLLGFPFSFAPGAIEGVSKVAAVRFGQEWTYRSQKQVLALRSTFNFGLDALGSTIHKNGLPDSDFFSWLGQVQWAIRFSPLNLQFVVRGDAQLSSSPLLGLEKFPIGGHSTVRGYRENLLVRDQGAVGSAELRIPLWQNAKNKSSVELAGFYDGGRSWSKGDTVGVQTLNSAGVGLRLAFYDRFFGQIYWGEALNDAPAPAEKNLQDEGLHFAVTIRAY